MVRLNIPLDPAKTGRDAVALESNLRRVRYMARLVDTSVTIPVAAFIKGAINDPPKAQAARILKRRSS